jgi:hypothetical protein
MSWLRLVFSSPSWRFILIPLGLLLWASPIPPVFAADRSDREEEGFVGRVESVVTTESVLVQTDRFDEQGLLMERIQGSEQTSQSLWPLRFLYQRDQAGRRTVEAVRDGEGALVKETRFAYDDHGDRSAEVATWGDGTFENASFYNYDEAHRRIRAIHYNAQQVINRNFYSFDDSGRLIGERLERNYGYDAEGGHVIKSDHFDMGYEVAMRYDDHGRIREKVVADLMGRTQGRSEFRYDEHGNQNEERIFNAEGHATDRKVYRYEYDAIGNWIMEALQWWDVKDGHERLKRFHIRERSLSYYGHPSP